MRTRLFAMQSQPGAACCPSAALHCPMGRRGTVPRAAAGACAALALALACAPRLFAEGDDASLPREAPIAAEDVAHWAFGRLNDASPPRVEGADWCQNAIDRFILARLEAAGLRPSAEADRPTLLRRVSFDLTGLPPPADLAAEFLADTRPDAYERLVERLLASPAHGERWAQYWLDLARFAETDGFEHDLVRPQAWRYRDWVIDALNQDLPFAEFVGWQVAGDQLAPGDASAAVATGFLLCGPDMPDINLQEERRHAYLNDMTGTVGAALLGLQIGCAQCHDHKYDPISQADFYRLRSFFEPMEIFKDHPLPGQPPGAQDGPTGRVVRAAEPRLGRFYVRGDFRRPGPAVEAAVPRVLAAAGARHAQPGSPGLPAHRADLARWLASASNPLAWRVMVNRVWQEHMGRGLVETPSDFGKLGAEPSHPELLDWLAARLIREGGSLKRLHALIVTSATYRQASVRPEGARGWQHAGQIDPENRLWWRMPRRRLEGEAIRDAMLAAAGLLSAARGGPGVRPALPSELIGTLLKDQWVASPNPEDHLRRSIYLFARRNLRYPLFEAFDRPDANASCPRRNRSTIAPQALLLLNSELTLEAARGLAGVVLAQAPADAAKQVALAYRRALGRHPADEELALALAAMEADTRALRAANRPTGQLALPVGAADDPYHGAALVDLCVALFNLNEFIYID